MERPPTHDEQKSQIRSHLRSVLSKLTESDRHAKSLAACALLASTPEFQAASTIMLFLSTPTEVDTATLALRAWQQGKTVVVPKVSWNARRMVPIEIGSLSSDQLQMSHGVREPVAGNPVPLSMLDLVVVPGLGFTPAGYRIGRGMGFYDRFLAQDEFLGTSCGLAFEEQIVPSVPTLDHDIALGMLATDRGIRRLNTPSFERSN
jgi:5-formyltetrahydrofolate cyclo-ligase